LILRASRVSAREKRDRHLNAGAREEGMSRLLLIVGLCGAFIASTVSRGAAQDDGSVVKLVVPFAPGGFPDTIGRLVATQLSKEGRQTFVVENRPGGAGVIAAEHVAKSAPDGRTLLVADAQQWAIAPRMLKNVRYNPETDFAPVTLLGTTGNFLVISPELGVSSFPELVALIKSSPNKYNYGIPGIGSIHHLTFEVLQSRLGLKLTQIPYKGGSEVIPALLSGQVQLAIQAMPSVAALAQEGKLKILAVTMAKRSRLAPNIATLEELGVPDIDFPGAIGILAPAGTPPAIVSRLAVAMKGAVMSPAVIEKLTVYAIEPSGISPDEFKKWIDTDIKKFRTPIEAAGLGAH
jgi:tripartite-type tricarboxylate transporter receptor subunit TctC